MTRPPQPPLLASSLIAVASWVLLKMLLLLVWLLWLALLRL